MEEPCGELCCERARDGHFKKTRALCGERSGQLSLGPLLRVLGCEWKSPVVNVVVNVVCYYFLS
jgi:hypothetical protein